MQGFPKGSEEMSIEGYKVWVTYTSESASFSVSGPNYVVRIPRMGPLRIIRAETFQPSIPFGRDFFRTYLLALTEDGILLFEQKFISYRPMEWKLVAIFKYDDLSYYQERELFSLIYDNLPDLVEMRPWERFSQPDELNLHLNNLSDLNDLGDLLN